MPFVKLNEKMVSAAEGTSSALRSKYGIWGLATISFVESALLVPIITDPFLIAYILANKKDTFRSILVTIISSVLGGIVAYFVAVGFFEVVISPLVAEETENQIHQFASEFKEGTFLLTFSGAITPIPYTLVAIGAGLVKANLFLFILATAIGRALRYGFEGWLVYRFGESALNMIKKQVLATTILCFIAIALYLVFKLS